MASRFSIEAVFRAVDKMSNPMKGMSRNTSKFSRALRTDFAKAQRSVDRFSKNFKQNLSRTAKRAVLGFGLAAAAGVGLAAKEFVDFENTVTASSAKFGAEFQKGTAGFIALGDAAREIGATTEFSATEAAKGLDFLALAGFNATQSMSLLPGVVDLATAAQTDLASASDIASDSLGAFGLMTKDTEQLSANFARTMDVMAKTTTTSNTDLATLFETVKKGAATFTASGQSLETFNALAGKLANAGLKGAESGTSLRNVMLRLAKPTGEASDVLKKLGIQTQDSQGNFRDVIDIIGDFEKGLVGMGDAQRTAALATVFGSRTVTGINLLLSEGSDSLRTYRDGLLGATGAAGEMAAVMRTSLSNQIKTLQSAALELGFKFVEAFQEDGAGAIQKLTGFINEFDITPIINGVRTATNVIKAILPFIEFFGPLVLGVVAAWKAYQIAMFVAATAQTALNVAMNANPLGLIITAIGLLIGAGILLIKNWDKVSAFLIGVWNKIKEVGVAVWDGIKLAFFTAVEFMKRTFFTFADLILTTYGNIFKAIIEGASKVGKFFGFDTTGIDNVISKIEEVQRKVREQSFIGGSVDESSGANREPVQAPVSSSERAASSRENSRAELLIKDETGQAEMSRNPRSRNFNFNLQSSGRM